MKFNDCPRLKIDGKWFYLMGKINVSFHSKQSLHNSILQLFSVIFVQFHESHLTSPLWYLLGLVVGMALAVSLISVTLEFYHSSVSIAIIVNEHIILSLLSSSHRGFDSIYTSKCYKVRPNSQTKLSRMGRANQFHHWNVATITAPLLEMNSIKLLIGHFQLYFTADIRSHCNSKMGQTFSILFE